MFGRENARKGAMALYAVYDRVAEEAGPCFLAVNDGVAVGTIGRCCKTVRSWPRKSTCCTGSVHTTQRQ